MKQACEVPWYWVWNRWRVGLTVNRTAPAVDDCPRAVVAPGKSEGSIILACRLLPRRWCRQAAATSCHYELPLRAAATRWPRRTLLDQKAEEAQDVLAHEKESGCEASICRSCVNLLIVDGI